MTEPLHPELIWAFTIDETKIGPVHTAQNIKVESVLQGEEKLSFELLPDDPKLSWINADTYVEYEGEAWRVSKRTATRQSGEHYVLFEGFPVWFDLSDDIKFRDFIITNQTISGGIAQILDGTGWSAAFMSDPVDLYSLESENVSALELLRAWAQITKREIRWNTPDREVMFVESVGNESQMAFRYGRNLDEVTQTYEPPQATRLYPLGANDTDITWVNGGIPYIENYDWYTAQGLTVDEARALYRKDAIWEDTNYFRRISLLDAAVDRLAELSQPTISYTCTVLDLSRLTGTDFDNINIGDTVWVFDETLGVEIYTRVLRLVRYPYSSWENEVELSYLQPGLNTNLMNSLGGSGGGSDWRLYIHETTGANVAGSFVVLSYITITSSGNSSGSVGCHVVGLTTGTGTIEMQVYISGFPLGGTISRTFSSGQTLDFAIPTWFDSIPEGSHTIELRARISSGSGYFTVGEFAARMYVFVNNTSGGGGGGSNTTQYISDVLWGDVFTPSGDGVTIELLSDISITEGETIADDTEMPTDSPPTIAIV